LLKRGPSSYLSLPFSPGRRTATRNLPPNKRSYRLDKNPDADYKHSQAASNNGALVGETDIRERQSWCSSRPAFQAPSAHGACLRAIDGVHYNRFGDTRIRVPAGETLHVTASVGSDTVLVAFDLPAAFQRKPARAAGGHSLLKISAACSHSDKERSSASLTWFHARGSRYCSHVQIPLMRKRAQYIPSPRRRAGLGPQPIWPNQAAAPRDSHWLRRGTRETKSCTLWNQRA